MTPDEWDVCDRHFVPRLMVEHVAGAESDRVRRLFGVALHLRGGYTPTDRWEGEAFDLARRIADGTFVGDAEDVFESYRLRATTYRAQGNTSAAQRADAVAGLLDPALGRDALCRWLVEPPRLPPPAEMRSYNDWCRMSVELVRCVFGNPFAAVPFEPQWRTGTVVALARQAHETGDYSAMPILADALQDAGCADDFVNHCRETVHVRGCRVVDAVLGLR